jgi:hypothetical protein
MKVGIIGSGVVAQSLGDGFVKHGHEAMLGTRDSSKLRDWIARNPKAKVGSFAKTAAFSELIVLAVKGTVAQAALRAAGGENLAEKTVIDAMNPIADAPPVNGVLKFFTTLDESLKEQLQREFPEALCQSIQFSRQCFCGREGPNANANSCDAGKRGIMTPSNTREQPPPFNLSQASARMPEPSRYHRGFCPSPLT